MAKRYRPKRNDLDEARMTSMPPLQFADVNGIRMGYYEAGPKSDPTPIVLCHGWPEIAFSWRHQIAALAGVYFHFDDEQAGALLPIGGADHGRHYDRCAWSRGRARVHRSPRARASAA